MLDQTYRKLTKQLYCLTTQTAYLPCDPFSYPSGIRPINIGSKCCFDMQLTEADRHVCIHQKRPVYLHWQPCVILQTALYITANAIVDFTRPRHCSTGKSNELGKTTCQRVQLVPQDFWRKSWSRIFKLVWGHLGMVQGGRRKGQECWQLHFPL